MALQVALQTMALVSGGGGGAACGGDDEVAAAILAAEARLATLRDPDWQRRKEREIRAKAAEARLGGLSPAQERFLRGEPATKPR